jgi:hypothetical protein
MRREVMTEDGLYEVDRFTQVPPDVPVLITYPKTAAAGPKWTQVPDYWANEPGSNSAKALRTSRGR